MSLRRLAWYAALVAAAALLGTVSGARSDEVSQVAAENWTGVAPRESPRAPKPLQEVTDVGPVALTSAVTAGSTTLPRDHGQLWREYDIQPYTSRITSQEKPEQAVVDWILRETGTETWFSEPLGLLSASRDKLRVYHTRQIQTIVADVVDRFVANAAESYVFGLRVLTVSSPNWRAKSHDMLRPVAVQTPGAEAWLLSKEDAAMLVAQLRKRADCVEHNSPSLLLPNGQTHTISGMRPVAYYRSLERRPGAWPSHQLQMGQLDEGFSVEFSPLLSQDQQTVDAVLRLQLLQVEKLIPVSIHVPTVVDPRQSLQIQVPQISAWRLHERFRWPADNILLVSCAMVAAPTATRPAGAAGAAAAWMAGSPRADTLLLLEAKGPASKSVVQTATELKAGQINYRGRY